MHVGCSVIFASVHYTYEAGFWGVQKVREVSRVGKAGWKSDEQRCGRRYHFLNAGLMDEQGCCFICLDTTPPPIQSGCACRGEAGLAHVNCQVQAAISQVSLRANAAWQECRTCKQEFTGAMRIGLAHAWFLRVGDGEESTEWIEAAHNLAHAFTTKGNYADAEQMFRKVQSVTKRNLGPEHPSTLKAAGSLASSLSRQFKHTEAERIYREVIDAEMRVLGAEHLDTLSSVCNLGLCLFHQEKYAKAEQLLREAHAVLRRLLGDEDVSTLRAASSLAQALSGQGKFVQAEKLQLEVYAISKRLLGVEHPDTLNHANNLATTLADLERFSEAEVVHRDVHTAARRLFGAEHPNTLTSARNVVMCLYHQKKFAEAEAMLTPLVGTCRRVLGRTDPATLEANQLLEDVRSNLTRQVVSRGVQHLPAGATRPMPAGTRVLVQQLVAKPEHNGKRARVLSFDARAGRYTVELDDGKELSLKAQCVARAGCAAVGCASEEASSVCARCQAVRYCSRECQRADWRVHKPACTPAPVSIVA